MSGKMHDVTDSTKATVLALKSFGNTHEEIATYLGISSDTLVRKYQYELDTACIRANARVATSLYKRATEKDDLSAQVFWLKTRARWRTQDNKDDQEKKSYSEQLFEQQFIE